jgi:ribulose 1,5-bisphosphate carboxylase large subunit-like protein
VRRSEFAELAEHVFGPSLARTYTHDLVLEEIGGLSAADALERGVAVRAVWTALCDAMEVPETARWEIPLEQRRR